MNNSIKPNYLPHLLRPSEIKLILSALNITWPEKSVNKSGWVLIHSPFRKDKNPSFSLNIYKGCFKDFAYPEIKGDIVDLVMLAKGYSQSVANKWITKTTNLNSKLTIHI